MKLKIRGVLGDLGEITGEVDFYPGHPGNYWDPPEPAEVQEFTLQDAFGIDIPDDIIFDNPENLSKLEELAWAAYEESFNRHETRAPVEEGDLSDLPF